MGGRGSSRGMSDKGKKYGTEYETLYQSGNIKYVKYNGKATTAPMETMTNGRIYATVDGNNVVKHITYYNKQEKRVKQIDLTHSHYINGKAEQPHTYKGYFHNEKGDYIPSPKELKMIDIVQKTWHYRNNKQ